MVWLPPDQVRDVQQPATQHQHLHRCTMFQSSGAFMGLFQATQVDPAGTQRYVKVYRNSLRQMLDVMLRGPACYILYVWRMSWAECQLS